MWDQYVSAKGTWVFVNEKSGLPLQTTEISCYREWGRCFEATAVVGDNNLLSIDTNIHEVERWDAHEIVLKPDDKACVRYTMRISQSQEIVTSLRMPLSKEGLCAAVANKELQLRLASGVDVYLELLRAKQNAVGRIMQKGQ